jgi:DNA polymerase-3 subunit epsilon
MDNTPIVDVGVSAEGAAELIWNVVIYRNPELQHLQSLVDGARTRLAEAEGQFSVEKRKVDALRSKLFGRLRAYYEKRDRLRLLVHYRKSFLDKLLHSGEEDANEVHAQYKEAEAETTREYESTANALAKKRELNPAEELELKSLWKKLVKLFHPDRIVDDPEKQETYKRLTQAINEAKEAGDLDMLKEIASDPDAFIRKQGWARVDLTDENEIRHLRTLLEFLQNRIVEVIEATIALQESPDFELHVLSQRDPSILDTVSKQQQQQIESECASLDADANKLRDEIDELAGECAW